MKRRPRVPYDTPGEQLKHEMSPEGAARQCRGTTWGWNVALGDGRITGGLQDRSMEGSSATESCWNVAQGCHTTRLGNDKGMKCRPRVSHDTHGEQLRHETSPKSSIRHPRGTIKAWNVAQGFRTARSSDVLGLECRSGSWARTEASASYFKVYSTTKAVEG